MRIRVGTNTRRGRWPTRSERDLRTSVTTRFPVRRIIRLSHAAYQGSRGFFSTVVTHRRYPWFLMHSGLADQVAEIISSMGERPDTHLYAWCVMPDHVHMLIQAPDVIGFVRLVKGRATPCARRYEDGRRLWQRSFFDHALRGDESALVVAQYVFENPVRGGLVETPADYVWSGSSVWPDWRERYRAVDGRG